MTAIVIQNFTGMKPGTGERLLSNTEAQDALDTRLDDGDLRPWYGPLKITGYCGYVPEPPEPPEPPASWSVLYPSWSCNYAMHQVSADVYVLHTDAVSPHSVVPNVKFVEFNAAGEVVAEVVSNYYTAGNDSSGGFLYNGAVYVLAHTDDTTAHYCLIKYVVATRTVSLVYDLTGLRYGNQQLVTSPSHGNRYYNVATHIDEYGPDAYGFTVGRVYIIDLDSETVVGTPFIPLTTNFTRSDATGDFYAWHYYVSPSVIVRYDAASTYVATVDFNTGISALGGTYATAYNTPTKLAYANNHIVVFGSAYTGSPTEESWMGSIDENTSLFGGILGGEGYVRIQEDPVYRASDNTMYFTANETGLYLGVWVPAPTPYSPPTVKGYSLDTKTITFSEQLPEEFAPLPADPGVGWDGLNANYHFRLTLTYDDSALLVNQVQYEPGGTGADYVSWFWTYRLPL